MNAISILDINIHTTSYSDAVQTIISWAEEAQSRMVATANVHMIMEAHDDPSFKTILNWADLVTPDGMPLVWMLRRMGFPGQDRVYGPDLMLKVLVNARDAGLPVGFYGSKPQVLEALVNKMQDQFPGLHVVYAHSPPFYAQTAEESQRVVEEINASAPKILFVALGCPKQERWIGEHRNKIKAVMIGVGAAFDIHAGTLRQAPSWMQKFGLEWFFRLMVEPRRLWKRYLYHNPRFIVLAIKQLGKTSLKLKA